MQDINLNQLKLKLNDTQKKEEKITTRFKAVNDEDVRNKECLDKTLAEVDVYRTEKKITMIITITKDIMERF